MWILWTRPLVALLLPRPSARIGAVTRADPISPSTLRKSCSQAQQTDDGVLGALLASGYPQVSRRESILCVMLSTTVPAESDARPAAETRV